jgi:hypothetical protein
MRSVLHCRHLPVDRAVPALEGSRGLQLESDLVPVEPGLGDVAELDAVHLGKVLSEIETVRTRILELGYNV